MYHLNSFPYLQLVLNSLCQFRQIFPGSMKIILLFKESNSLKSFGRCFWYGLYCLPGLFFCGLQWSLDRHLLMLSLQDFLLLSTGIYNQLFATRAPSKFDIGLFSSSRYSSIQKRVMVSKNIDFWSELMCLRHHCFNPGFFCCDCQGLVERYPLMML